jgi:chemosensory pili system protein ChpA (sensor histidine kinase/response regulator)
MYNDATLISNPLIWLKPEIDRSLNEARTALSQSMSTDSLRESALALTETRLQQIRGALTILSLRGAARFCAALEDAVARCAVDPSVHTRLNVSVIDRAMFALSQFLDDIMKGEPDVSLKLFPVYREVYEVVGRDNVGEIELFFPDLTPVPPPSSTAAQVEYAPSHVLACRAQFQRGLLAWLKAPRSADALMTMRASLDAVDLVAAQLDAPQGLFWSASGLIDICMHPDERVSHEQIKPLLARIERLMRDLASGTPADSEGFMREALYWLALCAPVSRRVREIKSLYRLDAQLPEFCVSGTLEHDVAALSPVLDQMRRGLSSIEDAWSRYTAGESTELKRLRDELLTLKGVARDLGHYRLLRLLDIVSLISTKLPEPYPSGNEVLALEMAAAFLFMEGMLDNFVSPPADIDQQVAVMVGWLLDAVKPRGNVLAAQGIARDDITQRQHFAQIRARVAEEIIENLRGIEQTVEQVARDPASRAVLAKLDIPIRQIAGALKMLGLSRANGVLSACVHLMKLSESEDVALTRASLEWVADGLSCLGFYLEALRRGEVPTESILLGFVQRLSAEDAHAAGSVGWVPADGTEPGQNDELAESEFDGSGTGPALLAPSSDTSERGEHGEVPSSSDYMLDVDAIGPINDAVSAPHPDAETETSSVLDHVVAAAEQSPAVPLGDTTFVSSSSDIEHPDTLPLHAPPQSRPDVVIGELRISDPLFQIYLRESAAHIASIDAELESIEHDPAVCVSDELTRAAHTLKSSSRTTGFLPVAALAEALEQCMHRMVGAAPDRASLDTVLRARAKLEAMLFDIRDHRMPLPADDTIESLASLEAPTPAAAVNAGPASAPEGIEASPSGDLDYELVPIFLEEAGQLLPQISDDLRLWRTNPDDIQPARSLARALHTLKGSARMAGALNIGERTHALESRVGMAVEGGERDDILFEGIESELDEIASAIDTLVLSLGQGPRLAADSASAESTATKPLLPPAVTPQGSIRVDADVLDRLVNDAGEVGIARARIEDEVENLKQSLLELTDSVTRLRSQLRETQLQADSQIQASLTELKRDDGSLDPLEMDRYSRLQELTRMMAETLHDIQMVQHTLLTNSAETEAALLQQARITRELQQSLVGLRSVPFNTIAERLQRTVRQTSRQIGKEAELTIEGGEREIDRSILQRIAAPLEHMLRNALAHGIEAAETRRSVGKPPAGRIAITVALEGNENMITLEDDGAGLDAELLRMEALRLGMLGLGDPVSDTALFNLIFAPGFSTASAVTETSGRGIGLDVVRAEIAGIGGQIEVSSIPGAGTCFEIQFPLTLASAQVLILKAGATYAIPASMVEQVQTLDADTLSIAYAEGCVRHDGNDYALYYLPRLLGEAEPKAEIRRQNLIVLLSNAASRLAVHVDAVVRHQEVVLKNIGPQLARVPGIAGGSVLSNGQIVLIVNPLQIANGGHLRAILDRSHGGEVTRASGTDTRVMVIDDSLTVRRLTARLLGRHGYSVITAKDGLDALHELKKGLPDLIILDIEMPRMDGFELTRQLRADPRTANLPIIVVTSRLAEKHQRIAKDLGINAFFGKPYPEDELIACIANLISQEA